MVRLARLGSGMGSGRGWVWHGRVWLAGPGAAGLGRVRLGAAWRGRGSAWHGLARWSLARHGVDGLDHLTLVMRRYSHTC